MAQIGIDIRVNKYGLTHGISDLCASGNNSPDTVLDGQDGTIAVGSCSVRTARISSVWIKIRDNKNAGGAQGV